MSIKILQFSASDEKNVSRFTALREHLYAGNPYVEASTENLPTTAEFFLTLRDGIPVARAAAIINPELTYQNRAAGMIGYFESLPDPENAFTPQLFQAIETYFTGRGISFIIGPMNGSTWQSYRATLPGQNPPFFLDNINLPHYASLFEQNSFQTIGNYLSTRVPLNAIDTARVGRFEGRFRERGFIIRPFGGESDLRKIHALSLISFRQNFLYTPLPFEPFSTAYQRIIPLINPQFVLLAERGNGEIAGFIFAVDNFYEKTKKELIIKTLAIAPEADCRGLGTFLVELVQKRAREAGYDAVYHALMHEDNASARIDNRSAEIYRTYRLYGKEAAQ